MARDEPPDDPLYTDAELVSFYDLENDRDDGDFATCTGMAEGLESVLDLGCGTGFLLARLSNPVRYGVDPAGAMLAVARARPGGAGVVWVEAEAGALHLDRHFDLVMLTGHAFQVFLDGPAQDAALASIARHLAPGGRFVFDSRNPLAREWEAWQPHNSRRTVTHPRHGAVEAWNEAAHDPATGIVTYRTIYRRPDGTEWSADSRIRFTPRAELEARLAAAGLAVERWMGGWDGRAATDTAPELIPIGRLA